MAFIAGMASAQPSAGRIQLGHGMKPGECMQDSILTIEKDTQILHPGSRRLFAHWEMLRAARAYPKREEFTFAPVTDLMPDMLVLERDPAKGGYRFRLAGSRVCELFGRNLTTRDALSGWDAFDASILSNHFELALESFQPVLARMRLISDLGLVFTAELIAMPIQARESNSVQLIGGLFCFRDTDDLFNQSIRTRELLSARAIWTEHVGATLQNIIDQALVHSPRRPALRPLLKVLEGGKSVH